MNSTHSLVSGTSAPSGKAAPAKPAPTVPKSALSHGKHATSTSHIRFGGELSDKIGKHVPPTPAIRGKPGAASKPNLPDLGKWDNQLQTESEREMKAKQLAAAKADSLERKIRIRKTSRSPSRPVSTEPAVLSEEQEPEGLMDEDSVEDEKSVALAPVSEKGSVQASLERLEF